MGIFITEQEAGDSDSRTSSFGTPLESIEARLAAGESVREACRATGVAVPSFYRWRARARARESAAVDTHDAIRESAKRLFLSEGFGVSMNQIAAVAGVARQTLFNRFGSKERLFREVIHSVFERMMQPLQHLDSNRDLGDVLMVYGRQYIEFAFDPEGIALHRLTIAELRKFPDVAMLMNSLGIQRAIPPLAEYLRLRMSRGDIREDDAELLAECFLSSVIGGARQRLLMNCYSESRERLEARLTLSVELFLAALRP